MTHHERNQALLDVTRKTVPVLASRAAHGAAYPFFDNWPSGVDAPAAGRAPSRPTSPAFDRPSPTPMQEHEKKPELMQELTPDAAADPPGSLALYPLRRRASVIIIVSMAVPAAVVAIVLAVAVLAGTSPTTSIGLALAWAILQLPLLIMAGARHRRLRRRARELPDPEIVDELGRRAADAEAAVRKDEERLHELRSTVMGITIAHRLLQDDDGQLTVSTRERLERLTHSELARLERLVASGSVRTVERIPLAPIIEPLAESVRVRGQRVSFDDSGAEVWGRSDDITEIVHILLENAVRHAPGSDVCVVAQRREDAVVVQVSDQGPGVAPEIASAVFMRGTRAPGSPGHGLGLHIARSLARDMGGDLSLEPTARGATFTMTLPTTREVAPCLGHSA